MSEVREGYKMTQLGEIPKEWEIKTTGELFENVSKKGYEALPVLSVTQENGVVYRDDLDINIKYDKKSLKTYKLIESGQFVISLRSFQGGIEYSNITGISSPAYTVLQPKEGVDKNYFKYLFKSFWFIDKLKGSVVGIRDGKQISYNDFKVIKLLLPPLKEQQKMVEVFNIIDKQIDETKQLIVKTKELKKGLMQQLLTKGIGHTEFKQTELGEIPSEWSLKSFAEITNVLKCGVASTPKYTEEGVIFLSSQNVKENNILLDKYNFISKDYHEELTKKVKPQNGDILYTRVGANFGKAAVVDLDFEFSVYVSLTLIRLKEGYDEHFYMQLLNSEMYQKIAKNTVFQGGGVPNLNVKEVEKFQMLVPSIEEQQKIAKILSTVDAQIEVYEQEKTKYEELKKGLMQKLLTGQIRVKI